MAEEGALRREEQSAVAKAVEVLSSDEAGRREEEEEEEGRKKPEGSSQTATKPSTNRVSTSVCTKNGHSRSIVQIFSFSIFISMLSEV